MATLTIQRQSTRSISIKNWLCRKNDFYSSLIEEPVTNLMVIKVNYALVSFLLFVSACNNLLLLLIFALNFLASVLLCRKGGLK